MTVALRPDVERIVADHLRTETGTRVVGQPPPSTSTAWIRVTRIGGVSTHHSDKLIPFMVQCDAYAGATGGQPEANTLGRAVVKALMEMPDASHSATVSGVDILDDTREPDTSFEPARERCIVVAMVYAHA